MEREKIRSQTLPIEIEHNQIYTEIRVELPDRQIHSLRCWLNPNSNAFVLTEAIAQQLHISYGEPFQTEEGFFAPFSSSHFFIGRMPLSFQHTQTLVALGKILIAPTIPAFGSINNGVLAPYQTLIDYQGKKLTLIDPKYAPVSSIESFNALHEGDTKAPFFITSHKRIPTTFYPKMKIVQTEVMVEDQVYKVVLDVGTSHTYFSRELLDDWASRYPNWSRSYGAFGTANTGMREQDSNTLMLRIPEITWGPYHLKDVSVVSREGKKIRQNDSYHSTDTSRVVGVLGGNILKTFRLCIDYPAETFDAEQYVDPDPHDMDLIGISLLAFFNQSMKENTYIISTVVDDHNDGKNIIQPGDKLLAVNRQEIAQHAFSRVVNMLRGTPGQEHILLLERDNKRFEAKVPVRRIL